MLKFLTKANTLSLLEQNLTRSLVLPQMCFTVNELRNDSAEVLRRVTERFNMPLIVRSSAISEDSESDSMAGKFLSLSNIQPSNIIAAMENVASVYSDNNPDNQILIQPMLTDIVMCGVLFTMDPNTCGNYYIINYDESGSTDSVTSGFGQDLLKCFVFRGKMSGNERLDRLIYAAEEIMELFGSDRIDIEFAFQSSGDLYILQARPLTSIKSTVDYNGQKNALLSVRTFLEREMRTQPYLVGKRTIYGIMPDWNPAEMIGVRPKPLAMSLYKRLITDGTWAYQRNNYGYKNLRSFPLMVDFCGLPYIDTRVSFNSFVPKDINEDLAGRLVDYYLDCLAAQPEKHDKVEFDIIFSCYTFDLPERIKVLADNGFSVDDRVSLMESLRKLTNGIINTKDGLWISDMRRISQLEERQNTIKNSDLNIVSKIYWLLEDCARYGTLPFAGLARAGFIAVLLLKSLISKGVLSENDYDNYIGQLNTIGSQMSFDRTELSFQAFLKKYGHLRPGTYDITSPRYDTAPDLYFGKDNPELFIKKEKPIFSITIEQYSEIQQLMENHGFYGDVLSLFRFLKAGIEGRESAKFIFTRSLSDVLELFAELGNQYGFSREDMAFTDISIINRLYSATDDVQEVLSKSIAEGRKKYNQTTTFNLPPVIIKPDDIYAFHQPTGTPNYITQKNVTGEICIDYSGATDIKGKILLIPAADPGYDWIFTKGISGFITAYGGVNSHMAIRSGELGIPAVIGAGEKLFNIWKKSQTLHIDCANKKVEVLR